MLSIHQNVIPALANEGNEVFRIQGLPPIVVACENLGTAQAVVGCYIAGAAHGALLSSTATQVTAEDTGFDGDTTTPNFSGQTLNNKPIIPRSVTIKPTAGGDTVNLIDRDGDGILYTDDNDEDAAGTVDYFTGALVLAFPTGKAPNTTNILADYKYENAVIAANGQKTFIFSSLNTQQTLVLTAACKKSAGVKSTNLRIEVAVNGSASGV